MVSHPAGWTGGLAGDTLLHSDLRADNLLLTARGSVIFLDWPGACRGVAWFDPLVMAPSVATQGGPQPEWLIEHHPSFRRADPEIVTTFVVALTGYFPSRSSCLIPSAYPPCARSN